MTAVIGILNKSAVAIAADSAMTMVKNGKILNTANKLFTLSKYHPVGVVIYNSSSVGGIPWEVLIKEYRRQRAHESQPTLEEYAKDFIGYVKSKVINVLELPRKEVICAAATRLFQSVHQEAVNKAAQQRQALPANEQTVERLFQLAAPQVRIILEQRSIKYISDTNPLLQVENLAGFTSEQFFTFYQEQLERTWKQQLGNIPAGNDAKNLAFNILYEYFRRENFDLSDDLWSGIGIIGYGENDLFPGCYMLHVAETIGPFLRVKNKADESRQIDDIKHSAIMPFAQRDVIEGFLGGVHPSFAQVYYQVFGQLLTGLNAQLAGFSTQIAPDLQPGKPVPQLQIDVNQLVNTLVTQTKAYQTEQIINPVVNSVAGLSKGDLAEMAESLIHLTYLHRRINSTPESVGGPIDVAVISKGDGFVWIKRKFYFQPEINPGFIQNYFTLRNK